MGVTAYILDTGIRSTHDDFQGLNGNSRVRCGYTAYPSEGCDDGNGHGTHVAGVVGGNAYGVAKSVSLVIVKVLDNAGTGTTITIIDGIEFTAQDSSEKKKPAVANLSLGGFKSVALDLAVSLGSGVGRLFFSVAAGNDNQDACLYSPASSRLITSVGATDQQDKKAEFSNFGACVDIFAPGVDVSATSIFHVESNGSCVCSSGLTKFRSDLLV
jgi:aqualysin 1